MAGLEILGGIGKGLMQGSQFIQQKNMQDEQLKLQQAQQADSRAWREQQQARLDEDQQWQRQDRTRLEAERRKTADYQALFGEVAAELGDNTTPEQLSAEVLKRGLKSGRIPQAEVQPLLQNAAKLRKLGVTAALRLGDTTKLAEVMSAQYGRPVTMSMSQGKDEFGNPSNMYAIVGEDGSQLAQISPMQLGAVLGADDLIEEYEQRQRIRKTGSEIEENRAQADAARALATQRRQAPAGGTGRPQTAKAAPAEVQTAEWLIKNGVVSDPTAAWEMVRTARGRKREDAIAGIYRSLQADPMNVRRDPNELVQQAAKTYDAIVGTAQPAQPAGAPHPVLGDAGQPPQATNQGQPVAAPGQRRPLDSFFSR